MLRVSSIVLCSISGENRLLLVGNLLRKNYGEATKRKQIIEQAQRDRASDRKKKGIECA